MLDCPAERIEEGGLMKKDYQGMEPLEKSDPHPNRRLGHIRNEGE